MAQHHRYPVLPAMLGLALSLGVAHASDVFSYGGRWAAPGLRMPAPQVVLGDGRMWTNAASEGGGSSVFVGTPEAGVTTVGAIPTEYVSEMRFGGGVWVRGWFSFDCYGTDLSAGASVSPDPDAGVQDFAPDAAGRLYLLAEGWMGTSVDVYGADGSELGGWALDFAWPDWRAWAACFDGAGRLCLLVTHADRYSIMAYDLSAGPAEPAAPVEVAAGSLDGWGYGQSQHVLTVARMAPGPSAGFVVASVSDAGGAILTIAAGGAAVRYQANAWYYPWGVMADPTRGVVWAVADGLYRIDGLGSCTYVGARGFVNPGAGLSDVVSLAAGTGVLAAFDAGNARITLLDGSGAASGHYDDWLPDGAMAVSSSGGLLYAVGLGAGGGLAELDLRTWRVRGLGWPAATWLGVAQGHVWLAPPSDTVVAVCIDAATGAELRRADLGLAPDQVADLAVAPDESGLAALTTDGRIVLFDGVGLRLRDWALAAEGAGRRMAFAGAGQVAVAVVRADDPGAPAEVFGYGLQGDNLWHVVTPAGLPGNPWHVPDAWGPNEIGGLAADPAGGRLYLADNLHGVIHCLQAGPLGDVNGDGRLDVADCVTLMHEWEDKSGPGYHPSTQGQTTVNADLNGDGVLDRRDAQILLEALLQAGGL